MLKYCSETKLERRGHRKKKIGDSQEQNIDIMDLSNSVNSLIKVQLISKLNHSEVIVNNIKYFDVVLKKRNLNLKCKKVYAFLMQKYISKL